MVDHSRGPPVLKAVDMRRHPGTLLKWQETMKDYLSSHNLWKVVSGAEPKPLVAVSAQRKEEIKARSLHEDYWIPNDDDWGYHSDTEERGAESSWPQPEQILSRWYHRNNGAKNLILRSVSQAGQPDPKTSDFSAHELWNAIHKRYKPDADLLARCCWRELNACHYRDYQLQGGVHEFADALYTPVHTLELLGDPKYEIPQWIYRERFIESVEEVNGRGFFSREQDAARRAVLLESGVAVSDSASTIQMCDFVRAKECLLELGRWAGATENAIAADRRMARRLKKENRRERAQRRQNRDRNRNNSGD